MNKICIEIRNADPIQADVSNEDRFSIKNALMAKVPFIVFADNTDGSEWIVRVEDVVTVNFAGGK